MIDQDVFRSTWTLLCERFGKEPSSPLMMAYYDSISKRGMTTAEFKRAAQRIFETREYFPRPADFWQEETEKADPKVRAVQQWEILHDVMRGFANVEKLDEEAQRVVRMMGGTRDLRMTLIENIPFVRRDFMNLYGDTVEVAARESGGRIAPTEASLRLTDDIVNAAMPKPKLLRDVTDPEE